MRPPFWNMAALGEEDGRTPPGSGRDLSVTQHMRHSVDRIALNKELIRIAIAPQLHVSRLCDRYNTCMESPCAVTDTQPRHMQLRRQSADYGQRCCMCTADFVFHTFTWYCTTHGKQLQIRSVKSAADPQQNPQQNIWRSCRKEFILVSADNIGYTGKMSCWAQGHWNAKEASLPVNILEIRAIFSLLFATGILFPNQPVCIQSDNATAEAYINCQGGIRSKQVMIEQPKDCMRLDETMFVKQLLPEICHFIHTHREGNQHAAELRISASGVLFSLSCNNFTAVFSRISTRLQELTVCSEDNADVHDIDLIQYINVDCAKLKRLLQETVFKFKTLKKVAQLAVINSLEKAFWNWVENYPDEFTKLYQRPQTDMADCAEKLFDLVDSFAESNKRKVAVWPLQIILLVLCPEIIQDISKEVVEENKMNKKLFLENLRKALTGHGVGKPLTESAAIACVKLCKASTYVNWEDNSVIFHLVQSLVIDLKNLLFNPSKPFSRGAGNQNADVDLMIDCLVSCFRINPHNNQHFKHIPVCHLLMYKVLNREEINLLSRGLSFVPTSDMDGFEVIKDLNLFVRQPKWKKFFVKENRKQCEILGIPDELLEDVQFLFHLADVDPNQEGRGPFTELKNKSSRMPPPMGDIGSVDIFLNLVTEDIMKLSGSKHRSPYNLTKNEISCLRNLENDTNIVIKPSDKGGNVVVMNSIDYRLLCLTLLERRDEYQPLRTNPLTKFSNELKGIIEQGFADGILGREERDFLLPKYPVLPTFYCLPKIHKGTNPLKGRPIVSGNNSLTEKLGTYIDKVLKPFLSSLNWFVRDTTDLLSKLDDVFLDPDMVLGSIDVEALYSSIPHDKGLTAVEYFLNTRGTQFDEHNKFILKILEFCLTKKHFPF
ncbi:unnamed protein product [Ranitomeya imitator]|uniref:Neurofibromin n=1 Tax=Ranitomeya imitator TaxID=111125 RepID=A0ABN9L3Z8_9NEOB|nr:unnamed protein product [Ranitomeya imitator]